MVGGEDKGKERGGVREKGGENKIVRSRTGDIVSAVFKQWGDR